MFWNNGKNKPKSTKKKKKLNFYSSFDLLNLQLSGLISCFVLNIMTWIVKKSWHMLYLRGLYWLWEYNDWYAWEYYYYYVKEETMHIDWWTAVMKWLRSSSKKILVGFSISVQWIHGLWSCFNSPKWYDWCGWRCTEYKAIMNSGTDTYGKNSTVLISSYY